MRFPSTLQRDLFWASVRNWYGGRGRLPQKMVGAGGILPGETAGGSSGSRQGGSGGGEGKIRGSSR